MKVSILGAGLSGLTAAWELTKQGHEVWVFEKNSTPGGAAGGFKEPGWDWYLDYAYHHIFTNDADILSLAKEIGFPEFIKKRPITTSLYKQNSNSQIYKSTNNKSNSNTKILSQNQFQIFEELFGEETELWRLDSPLDLLKFKRLSLWGRLRTGIVLAFLKFGPFLSLYERTTAEVFLKKTMGENSYRVLWAPLFQKKFTEFAQEINMAFFWARIKKRTPALLYPKGGFQNFVNHLTQKLKDRGVRVVLNSEIKKIEYDNLKFKIKNLKFDVLINTLQTPVFLKLAGQLFPQKLRETLSRIQYLGAQNFIFSSPTPLLPKNIYWLNVAAFNEKKETLIGREFMVAVEHTNFMEKKHYANAHLLYLAKYTNSPISLDNLKFKIKNLKLLRSTFIPYAQPLYTPEFAKIKPLLANPLPNLYFANMEMTYPYDRGTNYAVKVGREVAKSVASSK